MAKLGHVRKRAIESHFIADTQEDLITLVSKTLWNTDREAARYRTQLGRMIDSEYTRDGLFSFPYEHILLDVRKERDNAMRAP